MKYLQRLTLGIPNLIYILEILVLFLINFQFNFEQEKGISLEQYLDKLYVINTLYYKL